MICTSGARYRRSTPEQAPPADLSSRISSRRETHKTVARRRMMDLNQLIPAKSPLYLLTGLLRECRWRGHRLRGRFERERARLPGGAGWLRCRRKRGGVVGRGIVRTMRLGPVTLSPHPETAKNRDSLNCVGEGLKKSDTVLSMFGEAIDKPCLRCAGDGGVVEFHRAGQLYGGIFAQLGQHRFGHQFIRRHHRYRFQREPGQWWRIASAQ